MLHPIFQTNGMVSLWRLKWLNTWWIHGEYRQFVHLRQVAYLLSQIQTPATRKCFDKQTYFWELNRLTYQQKVTAPKANKMNKQTQRAHTNDLPWFACTSWRTISLIVRLFKLTRAVHTVQLVIWSPYLHKSYWAYWVILINDLRTQSIQLLLSFASASFLSLETEATPSKSFKATPQQLSPAGPRLHHWNLVLYLNATIMKHSFSNKSWTRPTKFLPSFCYTHTLFKFWLLQNFGTRIHLESINLLWSIMIVSPIQYLGKNMFRVSHAKKKRVTAFGGDLYSCLTETGEDGDMQISTHQPQVHLTKCHTRHLAGSVVPPDENPTMAIRIVILCVCSEQHVSSASRFAPFSSRKNSSSGARRTWPALFRLEELNGTRRN